MAFGAFLVLAADHRTGARGDYMTRANEVAIGLTLPHAAIAILRQRLAPAPLERSALLAERFGPEAALAAGFLDALEDADALVPAALAYARALADLDLEAHARSKARPRAPTLRAPRRGLARDTREPTLQGARRLLTRRAS